MSYQVTLAESGAPSMGGVSICHSNSSTLQFPSPLNFYALGDSFSAGIGANCGWVKDEFDAAGACLKCNGGYPYQIIEVANDSACMEVYHIGCTGASMNDILHTGWNNRTSQLELMASVAGEGGWGTLSIGGNDVGFASIVADCIMFDRPSCDADLNLTEHLINDPHLLSQFVTTYLKVLDTATHPDFKLIVPSYAQFFNAETEFCDNSYIFYGRYLTRDFRARINNLVSALNLVIQIAVSMVQMELVFGNSRKAIFYEDWDAMFEGHRFCEEAPATWAEAWFFTIHGRDTLPNETIITSGTEPPGFETPLNLTSLALDCNSTKPSKPSNLTEQMLCDWALHLADGIKPNGDVSGLIYPWWITKTLHPKSIAHSKLAKLIYRKWIDGDYF